MGQADRRGTFEERKNKAIISKGIKAINDFEREEKKEAELSPEERSKRSRDRLAMMSFIAMSKRSGLSPKEFKRRVLRYNKKGGKNE